MRAHEKVVASSFSQRYFLLWRWHFYAGLFVAPLLMVLAVTGLVMMWCANVTGKDGERITIPIQAVAQPLSRQAQAALNAVDAEQGMVVQYIAPRAVNQVALFRVDSGAGEAKMVMVNPYTAQIVKILPRNSNLYHLMDDIHGDMLLGAMGDYLLETAAALTVLMILTGLYLWWCSRKRQVRKMWLTGRLGRGRALWRGWHGVVGTYVAVMLLLFCVSGMAWAGVWGGKMVQAWSQFPAGKWGVAPNPTSALPKHGDLNDGNSKEIPWVLELTPMPISGSLKGERGIRTDMPITFDTVAQFAHEIGFEGRYQIYFPKGETGVWTINQDSMSYDSPSPTADRTVHIDRYSGEILADIRYADYPWFGQFMAVSIAFHMGTLGWWSVGLNTVFCMSVIFLCISGYAMWWQRRPRQAQGLCPPSTQQDLPIWRAAVVVLGLVAVLFPLAAVAIVVVVGLDKLLLSRVQRLQRWFK